MLTFVGLGLYDERSITVEGRAAVRAADRVVAEFYTSRLAGTTVEALGEHHGVAVEVRDRAGVEQDPDFLGDAAEADVAFLTAGDPMMSTTHVDLRLRAHERGIETRVVHGVTAATAAAGLSGLQNYRFGKATTLPFPDVHAGRGRGGRGDGPRSGAERDGPGSGANGDQAASGNADAVPDSVLATLRENRERGLHTLVYLDIDVGPSRDETDDSGWAPGGRRGGARTGGQEGDRFMTADRAAGLLAEPLGDPLGVAIARAGSPDPVVAADRLSALAERSFGDPLHLLVVPGDLHHLEAESLAAFGGAPDDALPDL